MKTLQYFAIFGMLLLSACGSGSGGDVKTGQFKDSEVKGLKYKTATQNDITDTNGTFKYKAGETVEFYLGEMKLGEAQGANVLYPKHIASSEDAIKIAQLLQTLDIDGNPDVDGINIQGQFLNTSGKNINNLTQTMINEISTKSTPPILVNKDTAKAHMQATIDKDINGFKFNNQLFSREFRTHTLSTNGTGFFEIEIQTGVCSKAPCCQVSVSGEGHMQDVTEDEKKFIRLIVQSDNSDITLRVRPLSAQCYYNTPYIVSVRTLDTSKTTITAAQGDGKNYENLSATKTDNRLYLQDISRRNNGLSEKEKIQTLKSIGLGVNKFTRHSAELAQDLNQSGVDAHANSIKTYDYLKTILGMSSYDNKGASLLAVTDYLYPRIDAFLCGSNSSAGSWFNAFYQGSGIYYTPAKPNQGYDKSLSSIVNVAAHEWGHAVTNAASKLVYSQESGAINEAFSDWLGIAVEQHYSTGEKSWLIGFADKPFRSMENPSIKSRTYRGHEDYKILIDGQVHTPTAGDSIPYPDTYKGNNWITVDNTNCPTPNYCANDYCGVHINSSVANKMFYLLSVGGIHNGITVTGIGTNNAMKIALDANRNRWTTSTGFHNAKAGMIAASTKFGNTNTGTNMQQQVRLAWEAVNVLDSNE
ncbi:Zinc metalloproteinase precursor / aureolysin [uncultured Candidatus Thioglobus sp.]|nr:Zinc metalloproteinase precursor / aureolysin [uncultured Candidatus Thioglobus sp.]